MTVVAAPFKVRVVAEGNLSAVRSTPLAAPMRPRMAFTLAWLIDDGTVVEEGDIVARFDPSQLEKDREDGLSDRRISDHRISSARTNQEVTIGNLDRDAEVAEEELEVAQEFQSTDDLGYSKMEIIESQIDTELAETRADHARKSQEIQDELSDTEIELLAIDRRKADIKIQQAVDGLAALEVTAPHSGIVMLERDWRGNRSGSETRCGPGGRSGAFRIWTRCRPRSSPSRPTPAISAPDSRPPCGSRRAPGSQHAAKRQERRPDGGSPQPPGAGAVLPHRARTRTHRPRDA